MSQDASRELPDIKWDWGMESQAGEAEEDVGAQTSGWDTLSDVGLWGVF